MPQAYITRTVHIANPGRDLYRLKVLRVLGLDGVCAAAANEFAFGGCAPPISRCETGKLFNPLIHLQSSFAVLSEEINILLIAPH